MSSKTPMNNGGNMSGSNLSTMRNANYYMM